MARGFDCDVLIAGGGVVGCAIARELSLFDLRVTLLEAGPDVGAGTSKANTALLHTGFDAKPGTLEAELVVRGYEQLGRYAERVGIPVERTGALLVAWDEEQLASLPGIVERSRANGYEAIRELSAEELYRREPYLGAGALGALEVPDEGIICPFTTPLAFATEAVRAGCELRRGTAVTAVERLESGGLLVRAGAREWRTRFLVNAAGLRSDELDRMLGHDGFTVTPRRGELIVFDKLSRPLVSHIVLAVPTKVTKGVLIAPTVFGNVMLGPTAEDVERKDDTSSTAKGLAYLRAEGRRIMPELLEQEVTAVYVGLRAATEHADYQVSIHADEGYVCVGGIRSTGLSGSMAIAEHVRGLLADAGLALSPRPDPAVEPSMPNIGEASLRPYADAERIARDPEYGRIVCFCERVTRGEIRDALASPVPPVDLDGLRRRTRAHMGRCQGFFCGAELASLLEPEGRANERRDHRRRPAGLTAAAELGRLGVRDVVVIERERDVGGIPRHAAHQGFGLRDLRRPLSGPGIRAPARLARARGRRRAADRDDGHGLVARRPARADRPGRARAARARRGDPRERLPRAAALGPARSGLAARGRAHHGHAPAARLPEGRAARRQGARRRRRARELLGAPHAHARRRPPGRDDHRARRPSVAGRVPGRRGASLPHAGLDAHARQRDPRPPARRGGRAHGPRHRRHPQRRLRNRGVHGGLDTGQRACADGRARARSRERAGPPSTRRSARRGPACSRPATSCTARSRPTWPPSAGATPRGLSLASWRAAAGPSAPSRSDPGRRSAWVSPNALTPDAGRPPRSRFVVRSREFLTHPRIEIAQDGRALWSGRLARLVPGRSGRLADEWTARADPEGGPVTVFVASARG